MSWGSGRRGAGLAGRGLCARGGARPNSRAVRSWRRVSGTRHRGAEGSRARNRAVPAPDSALYSALGRGPSKFAGMGCAPRWSSGAPKGTSKAARRRLGGPCGGGRLATGPVCGAACGAALQRREPGRRVADGELCVLPKGSGGSCGCRGTIYLGGCFKIPTELQSERQWISVQSF